MEEKDQMNDSGARQAGYSEPSRITKAVMVVAAAVVAFYFAYSYAAYLKAPSASLAYGSGAGNPQAGNAAYSNGSYGGGSCCGTGSYGAGSTQANGAVGAPGGCCGGGSGGPQITKETRVSGDRQYVDMVVNGGWNPNVIKAKAGLPLTINLDVQQAGGCISALVFPQLNINVPLQSGTKTAVEIPPLNPGTYGFSCQMGMVNGQLVVE